MLGHLVNALDGNQAARRPMLEDVRTGAAQKDMHIGPPMSMAPMMVNVGGGSELVAVIQAAADYQEGRELYFEDKRQKEKLERQLLGANAELDANRQMLGEACDIHINAARSTQDQAIMAKEALKGIHKMHRRSTSKGENLTRGSKPLRRSSERRCDNSIFLLKDSAQLPRHKCQRRLRLSNSHQRNNHKLRSCPP
jgi:hypothetical protein